MFIINDSNIHIKYLLESYTFITFLIFSVLLSSFLLLISYFLGGKSYGRFKNVPFESGIVATGNTNLRFPIHFYLIGMFFLIFDVESLYLYLWSVSIYKCNWFAFVEIFAFIFSLLIGLFYLIGIGALNWTKKNIY